MKITKQKLYQIIKEELTAIAGEGLSKKQSKKEWEKMKQAKDPGKHIASPSDLKRMMKQPKKKKIKENVVGPPSPSVSLEALWRDLNSLLTRWTDKEHQYYRDLYYAMEAYSTSPDRPSLPPESEDDDPGFTLSRPKEDPMGRGAHTSKLRRSVMNLEET